MSDFEKVVEIIAYKLERLAAGSPTECGDFAKETIRALRAAGWPVMKKDAVEMASRALLQGATFFSGDSFKICTDARKALAAGEVRDE